MDTIISIPSIVTALKALVAGSIFFVWVVRYQNIVEEFKDYGLPPWLRDLVGILKLSFTLMLFSSELLVIFLGAFGISILMLSAMLTHFRVRNPFFKVIPSMTLMLINASIAIFTFQNF